jgi:hypothetical protein
VHFSDHARKTHGIIKERRQNHQHEEEYMAGSHLDISLGEMLNELAARGASDEELHRRWLKEHAKRRKEYYEKELEWERLQFEKRKKALAFSDEYFKERLAMRKRGELPAGWELQAWKEPEAPPPQIPVALDDDSDKEEAPEGSWDELWQEIYRCEKEGEEDLEDELPGSFGELMSTILSRY